MNTPSSESDQNPSASPSAEGSAVRGLFRAAGRPPVAAHLIEQAANELLRRGERPTVEKVRALVGGSPNRIGPILEAWWKRIAEKLKEDRPGPLERLPTRLAHIAESFFLAAVEEARRYVEHEQQRTREAQERTRQDLEVKSHLLSLREEELETLRRRLEERVDTLEALLRAERLALRRITAERDHALERIRKLEAEIERAEVRRARARPRSQTTARPSTRSKKSVPRRERLVRPRSQQIGRSTKKATQRRTRSSRSTRTRRRTR